MQYLLLLYTVQLSPQESTHAKGESLQINGPAHTSGGRAVSSPPTHCTARNRSPAAIARQADRRQVPQAPNAHLSTSVVDAGAVDAVVVAARLVEVADDVFVAVAVEVFVAVAVAVEVVVVVAVELLEVLEVVQSSVPSPSASSTPVGAKQTCRATGLVDTLPPPPHPQHAVAAVWFKFLKSTKAPQYHRQASP